MRQKKHDFRTMSDQKCSQDDCRTMIKQNVIDRKQSERPLLCNKHFLLKWRKGSKA